jgi:exodeoxyribonuclease V alpha subunit
VVREIDHEKETVTVDFEDKLVRYIFEQLPELEPAFAMTVHKSQGSEYHAVILAIPSAAPQLLTRGVLYTAMSRAKNLLVLVGSPEIMEKMVRNDRRQKRYSGLRARLADGGVDS